MQKPLSSTTATLPPMYLTVNFYATPGRLEHSLREVVIPIEGRVIRQVQRYKDASGNVNGRPRGRPPRKTDSSDLEDEYEEGFFEALAGSRNKDPGRDPPYLRPAALAKPREAADLFFSYHRISMLSRSEANELVMQLPQDTPEQVRLRREVRRRMDELTDDAFDDVFNPDAIEEEEEKAEGSNVDSDDDSISSENEDLHALIARPLLSRETRRSRVVDEELSSVDSSSVEDEDDEDSNAEPVELDLSDDLFDDDDKEEGEEASPPSQPVAPSAASTIPPPSSSPPLAPEVSLKRPRAPSTAPVSTTNNTPDRLDPTWLARNRASDCAELMWMTDVAENSSERFLLVRLKDLRTALEPIARAARCLTNLKHHLLTDTYRLMDSLRRVHTGNVIFDRSQLRHKQWRTGTRSERMIMLGMLPLVLAMMPEKLRRMIHVPSLPSHMHAFYQRYVRGDVVSGSLYEASLRQFMHNTNYIWDLEMQHAPPGQVPAPVMINTKHTPPPPRRESPSRPSPQPRGQPVVARMPPPPQPPAPLTPFAYYQMELQQLDHAISSQSNALSVMHEMAARARINLSQMYAYRNQIVQAATHAMTAVPTVVAQPPPSHEVVILDGADTGEPAQPRPSKRPRLASESTPVKPPGYSFVMEHVSTQ